ncbi:MAG: cupin domain-containing protein [Pseudomonadota bacterium]
MAGVGTTVVFEDEKIKVWEFELEPGEETPVHTHEHEYIFYVLDGTTLQVFDENKNDLGTLELNDGDVVALHLDKDELVLRDDPSYRIPATHSAKNVGPGRYREMLIETK